ncbi:Uncharacterized protein HZ326_8795 [Fusarium oxysporum f. sp. albedinis]|nr:Uncharacterized protein HZ326_8795 [Fusarium oxysporum f. sp. albedinis]
MPSRCVALFSCIWASQHRIDKTGYCMHMQETGRLWSRVRPLWAMVNQRISIQLTSFPFRSPGQEVCV